MHSIRICWPAALLLASRGFCAAPQDITAHQASSHIGEEVTVSFYVRQTGFNSKGSYQELYSEFAWDIPHNLFIRIPPSTREKLEALGIYDLAGHFSSRSIRVRGTVQDLTFGSAHFPAIYIESLDQIQVLRPPEYKLPLDAYEKVAAGDFTLHLSPEFTKAGPEFKRRFLDTLTEKADAIKAALPALAYEHLKGADLYVNVNGLKTGAAYHSNIHYLNGAGMPSYYLHAVEIHQARDFLDSVLKTQPWAVLHELAHKYHNEVLGNDHKEVIAAYQNAKTNHLYESVKRSDGTQVRAYAMADPMEYFAELTEAYFGRNDFYPFIKSELREHDRQGYDMIEKCWGVP